MIYPYNYYDSGTTISGINYYESTSTITNTSFAYAAYTPTNYHTYQTYLGSAVDFSFVKNKKTKVIHPQLYFKFVKSKMTKLQKNEMHERLSKLKKLLVQAEDLGQKALYEELARKIAITVKEQEINVCGIEYVIHRNLIEKYRSKVDGPSIEFCRLENYTRSVPANVKKRIDKCKELKLFDQYWVLFLDYKDKTDVDGKKKSESIKTNKQKIKEKDPILFGLQDYLPDKFYFIIDWIDQYCDLTLDKFVDTIKKDDPEYDLDCIDEINAETVSKLIQESKERYDRLQRTNSKNYKELMEKEDKSPIGKKITGLRSRVTNLLNKLEKK